MVFKTLNKNSIKLVELNTTIKDLGIYQLSIEKVLSFTPPLSLLFALSKQNFSCFDHFLNPLGTMKG